MTVASVTDYRDRARRRLPHFLFEYIDGGSYAEVTLQRNIQDLKQVALRQRVLQDVSEIDFSSILFGKKHDLPIALAPIGLGGLNARRGERQAVKAAEACGIPFTLSTVSACALEEVADAASQPFWFQLYMLRDRGFMRDLLARARGAGCSALVFTVDMPVPGSRYRDYHSGLAGAPGIAGAVRRTFQGALRPNWAWDVGVMGRPHSLGNVAPILKGKTGIEDFFAWMRDNFDPTATWKDLDFIRSEWDGPLIIKGILDPADAREAVRLGADGLVVSNHGGRQLDGVPSTAKALPPIADAVSGDLTIMADGGIRSGLDVVRMLALGAQAVMLGRPWAYALGAGGQAAVEDMLQMVKAEMRIAMALTGVTSISSINDKILVREPIH